MKNLYLQNGISTPDSKIPFRNKLNILMIEDNPFDAEMMMAILDQTYYADSKVVHCKAIAAAKEILFVECFDIIIIDLCLNDSDAPQTLGYLKKFATFAPVIVCSSYDDKNTIREIIGYGADDCVPKSDLNASLFERIISYAIDRWRLNQDLYKMNQRVISILVGTGIGTWEWNLQTNTVTFDDGFAKILGYTLDEFGALPFDAFEYYVHVEDKNRSSELLVKHLSGESDYYDCEMRLRHKSDYWIWVLMRGKLICRANNIQPKWVVGTLLDITKSKQDEELLRIILLMYKNTAESIMVTDKNNCIVSINPAFTALTGYDSEEVFGKNPRILKSEKQDKKFYQDMWSAITHSGKWEGEIWNRKKNGDEFIERLNIDTIHNADGSVQYRVAQFSDITEKKLAESLIWTQANFDSLTNLPNRRLFADRLEQAIKDLNRNATLLALLLIDLDHFNEINDALGHHVGDALLIEVGKRIKNCLRESDTVARLGGDEFTVILPQLMHSAMIEDVAQKIMDVLTLPFVIGEETINVSVSIGVTVCPNDGVTIIELLKNADQAMYAVKKNGRSGYGFFTPEMQEAAYERRRLTKMMHEALSKDQFMAYFQPIIELQTGRIHKAEALLRWEAPEYGFVNPSSFIPIAEQTSMIHEIGEWMLKQAVDEVIYCQEAIHQDFQISVNMSPVQFLDESKARNQWKDYIIARKLHRGIVVEITEGLLLKANVTVHDKFRYFQDHGVEVAIDDFGTGYSSLSYLKKFHIHYVKIDRSFIHNLVQSNEDLALCEAIVVMAHKLGLKVIAEGVETEQQKDILIRMGCDYGQGFLFARPMARKDFRSHLAKHKIENFSSSGIARKDVSREAAWCR